MNQRVRVWFFYKKWWTLRLKFQTITNQNFEIKTSRNELAWERERERERGLRGERSGKGEATAAGSGGDENTEKTNQWSFGHGSLDEIEERERWLQTKISSGLAICLSCYSTPHATTITQSWISFSLCAAVMMCFYKCEILKFKV